MALDWDYQSERLFGFESFKEKEYRDRGVYVNID
jgi:hypothetical protein